MSDTVHIKKTRMPFDYRSDGKVYCAKWYNNSVLTAASNEQTHSPLQKFKRRIEGQRKDINQPDLIRSYNNGMGGVDLLDRILAFNSRKKMVLAAFVNILNVATVAAWRIHCKAKQKSLMHLKFRRKVILYLWQPDCLQDKCHNYQKYVTIAHMGFATQGSCRACQK
ncbi:PiggyBac transposable element-derived protein 3 [Trichinella pseudospiralis]|uniref:PiggyBac transposable element-derived protein 3 n=2 Tax=Trichinella pseudospiralis TaxID=6337 RepID=A0A0V1FBV1_TRIPS|nr:PiggyBac transposable element-derived protein 3 [Trichinella pseudospiralis]